ncbi:MAG TPA: pseudouridine-5'-phosphate glycosidase [Geminicoccaceae bacterium]|nr:pseudouridine-5'-phosphate glycosidase [Geminicoccaceae bacterium]
MPIELAPKVAQALAEGRAVVALESTLICHGIPRPRNLELALEVERTVSALGAVPATVAVIDGRVRVGLDEAALVRLAEAEDVMKCSTRDLALALAQGRLGATTVAATIFVAGRVGIPVMATGGLGGVHRGGQDSLDISADLHELGRAPVAVVCSGAKSILDLPRTLEVLETAGVTLVGFGTDELPAFYARESGLGVLAVRSLAELRDLIRQQAALGWPGAVVVANPPPERLALPGATVEALVRAAVAAAREQGVRGAAETPFVLAHMARASGGATVALNEALVIENARLAAALAAALARA